MTRHRPCLFVPRPSFRRLALTAVLAILALSGASRRAAANDADAIEALPPNLGLSLRQLIVWHRAQPNNLTPSQRRAKLAQRLPGRAQRIQTNANATRAVVDVMLDGSKPLAEVRANLTALGLEILAEHDTGKAGSTLSAQLPLNAAEAAVRSPGVYSVSLVSRPWRHVGKVTSQGTGDLGSASVNFNSGYDGKGITVGVISDSFDVALDDQGSPLADRAADDVASDDLPGSGNPAGHTQPVMVLAESGPSDTANQDEGRAMLQIIHDVAPGAALVFATCGSTPETYAENIRRLRTDPAARCDVMVDDILFPQEPMFSDGVVAQAVNEVTHSAELGGRKALYYSAAGNTGQLGYAADFNSVSDADARAGQTKGNLKLDQVPAKLTAGGFHNFDIRPGHTNISQRVTVADGGVEVSFQWDDPFLANLVTTDYNLLVFDAAGNYLRDLSGIDKNIKTGQAVEVVDLDSGKDGAKAVYQFAIARTAAGAQSATHLRYVANTYGEFTAKFAAHGTPTIFGHAAAPGADAVAAYATGQTDFPESYSSRGPVTVYFSADGTRLDKPEVRQQPTLAAVDGVDTTFFPIGPLKYNDSDGNGFPNFFGTSAAAPHAAGCAALLLQAAGGHGSLTNGQARLLLESSAKLHLLDPDSIPLQVSLAGTTAVTLTAQRTAIDPADHKKLFHLALAGADGESLRKIIITIPNGFFAFDDSPESGAPFAIGGVSGSLQAADVSFHYDTVFNNSRTNRITLNFPANAFKPGDALSFGMGLANPLTYTRLDPFQALASTGQVSVQVGEPVGKARNKIGVFYPVQTNDYSSIVGYGIINVEKAVALLKSQGPPYTDDSRTPLTRGNLLLTTNDGRVLEITRTGKIVQTFSLPDEGVTASSFGIRSSTVTESGKIVVLNGGVSPYLTIFDPATGATSRVDCPNWYVMFPHNIVSRGESVFVCNDSPNAAVANNSSLLRYDLSTGAWQSFGEKWSAGDAGRRYNEVFFGKDGLLYAAINPYALIGTTPIDNGYRVFDPESLQVVETKPISPAYAIAALDPSGNFYVSPLGSSTLNKLNPAGMQIGSAVVNLLQFEQIDSIQLSADGSLFATYGRQLIMSDTALRPPQTISVFEKNYTLPTFFSITVALIGP